jgi:hypothetical protein
MSKHKNFGVQRSLRPEQSTEPPDQLVQGSPIADYQPIRR